MGTWLCGEGVSCGEGMSCVMWRGKGSCYHVENIRNVERVCRVDRVCHVSCGEGKGHVIMLNT